MKYIVSFLKNGLLLICMSFIFFTACNSRKERIDEQVSILYSNRINVPSSEMETIVYDSTYSHQNSNFRLLVYLDSTECTPCYASHHQEWEYILKECRKIEPSISLTIIIETKNLSEDVKGKFFASNFGRTIFIDKEGAFRRRNPFFPESEIMHVLLLDNGGRVLLVGNPLNNKKIEEMLYSKLRNS
ncbi:MAG: hypothetical protein J6I52_02670 [Prevotella sp.]|nr:hypothetical protein [Prevotella sp.]